MSPPGTLHRSGDCAPSLSPNFKIFLSGSVLFFGAVGTLPFFQTSGIPPLPPQTVVAVIPDDITVLLPITEPKGGSAMTGSPFDLAQAAVAVQSEKYARAYPEPILVSEVPVPDHAEKSTESPPKPFTVPVREFAAIHRLVPNPTTPFNGQTVTFDEQPECVDPSKLVDSLLPMFHFAENLKPSPQEVAENVLPENPFLPLEVREDRKLSPLRPYVELRPLRLPEKK